jgi:hypothetical protein
MTARSGFNLFPGSAVWWHAHVFVGMFQRTKDLRTCPGRRAHATHVIFHPEFNLK